MSCALHDWRLVCDGTLIVDVIVAGIAAILIGATVVAFIRELRR